MRSGAFWFVLLLLGLTAVFAYDGCDVLFNRRVVGYTTKYGNQVRFRDNGDRFLYAVGLLVIAIVGADGVRRFLQAERKEISDRRWGWEVTVDGRTIERPPPTEDSIRADLDAFEGKLAGCVLTDRDTGSRMWCYGEPERRVVEASLVEASVYKGNEPRTGVVARDGGAGAERAASAEPVHLRTPFAVDVPASAVLNAPESVEILLAFFHGKRIPSPFTLLPTTFLAGNRPARDQPSA